MKKFWILILTVVYVVGLISPAITTTAYAEEGDKPIVMSVRTWDFSEEIYKEFDNFEDGWVFIYETFPTYFDDFDVKLYADWIAPDGRFYYTDEDGDEAGTDDGRLIVESHHFQEGGHTNFNKINIDLNGHKIDRNLKEPTKNGQVFYIESGTVRIFDSSKEQTGMITGANNIGNGGAFLVDNGILNLNMSALYIEGGTITGNYATNGSGVYWNSDGVLVISDGVISGNYATENGGGLFINDWGSTYIGGTPVIKDNYITGTTKQSNMYIGDTDAVIKLTKGQKTEFFSNDIPDLPLSEGAKIGLSSPGDDEKLTGELSLFKEEDFTFFFPDDPNYFVRSVCTEDAGVTSYDLYYTSWQNENKRAPRVTNVAVKDTGLVKGIDFNYDQQILTLTVPNNKRDYFNILAIDRLVSFEFNDPKYYLARANNPLNLIEGQQYRITADNNTYVLLNVKIVPEGGKWAEVQDSYETEYAAIVYNEYYTSAYVNVADAWADAMKQSMTNPTTFKLLSDWCAVDGEFYSENKDGDEYGTENGYLDVDNENIDLTLDLNGHTIDRNLKEPISDGFVIYIGDGTLSITDTSKNGNGKITGGNCSADGGAIFMDNAPLGIEGGGNLKFFAGNITGNHASGRGGAIYSESNGDIHIFGGNITNNTAKHGGAIAFDESAYLFIHGGELSGNSATEYGGALYGFTGYRYTAYLAMDGGVICNNTAKYGGGIYADECTSIYSGGYIMNNTADYGGGIYTRNYTQFNTPENGNTIGVQILNNTAEYDGGGIYAEGDEAEIKCDLVTIKGNTAENGAGIYWNGRGVYWNGGGECLLNRGEITENVALGIGGGVYVPDEKKVYLGGEIVIKENSSSLGDDNVNLRGDDSFIYHGPNLYYGIPLNKAANIGVRAEKIKGERVIIDKSGGFNEESINCFTSDDPRYYVKSVADANYNGYKFSLVYNYNGEMLIEVEGQTAKSFTDFNEGWVYALKQSLTKPTTITLGADWIASNGSFYCVDEDGDEYGSNNGYLYIDDNHNITIDLNGHKIDRNLKEATDDGVVFWLNDLDAKFTVKDSAGGGKITGANNDGDGGAFYVYNGSLFIEGGEITGNYADNGAGIYWYSDNNLSITGGKITGNTALENGGGIYHAGGGLIGGNTDNVYLGGGVQIYDNLGADGENNNVYVKSLRAINRTAGQSADIPDVLFTDTAKIGIFAQDTEIPFGPYHSRFDEQDYRCFFADKSSYYIRPVYKEDSERRGHMLFITSKTSDDAKFPAIESVNVINSELLQNAVVNNDTKVITLTGYKNKKDNFKNIALSSLIDFSLNGDASSVSGISDSYDLTESKTYKVMSDNGTYVSYTVVMEWICIEHEDADDDCICDYCGVSIFNIV